MPTAYLYICPCGGQNLVQKDGLGAERHCPKCKKAFVPTRENTRRKAKKQLRSSPERKPGQQQAGLNWKPGDVVLNAYEIVGKLGEGGMGRVLRIYHRGWDTDLAVKIPKPAILSDVVGMANFERECQTWVDLGLHPHIVACYFVRKVEAVPLVFAEYVRGGSLADWIARKWLYAGGKKRACARMLDVAIQAAWGLHYAHEQGLVHQDMKPANVMLTRQGVVKVTDFGLARALASTHGRVQATKKNRMVSKGGMTPAYASPEQVENRLLDIKTDMWSWAVSVLEMFVGSVLWMSGTVAPALLEQYLEEIKDKEHRHRPPMPRALGKLLQECFREDPMTRPENMLAVADKLQEIYFEVTEEFYARDVPSFSKTHGDDMHVGGLNNGAVSMVELGRTDRALDLLKDAELTAKAFESVEPSPALQEIAYNRCLLQIRTNPVFDAKTVAQSVPRAPDATKHAYYVGILMLEAGELSLAIDSLTEALETGQGLRAEILNARGIALLLSGEVKPAVLSFSEGVRCAPERADIQRNLAVAYYYDGRIVRGTLAFQTYAQKHSLDEEDHVRYAALLSTAGLQNRSRDQVRASLAAPGRNPRMLLTAAELMAGVQTFLPGVRALGEQEHNGRALVREALDQEKKSLRAQIDYATYPARRAISGRQKVVRRELVRPEVEGGAAVGQYYARALSDIRHSRRSGAVPRGPLQTRILVVAALAPLLVALLVWRRIIDSDAVAMFATENAAAANLGLFTLLWAILFVVVSRRAPRGGLWREAILGCFGLPFMLYLPTAAHRYYLAYDRNLSITYFDRDHVDLLLAIGLALALVFISRELIYRHFAARARAFGSLFTPPPTGQHAEDRSRMVTFFTSIIGARPASDAAGAGRALTRSQLFAGRLWAGLGNLGPETMHRLKLAATSFGTWQLFLLPQYVTLAVLDSRAIGESEPEKASFYFLLMLACNLLLLGYGALIPRIFLPANFGLAALTAMGVCQGLFSGLSLVTLTAFAIVAGLFCGLNWMSIQRCPAFVRPLESFKDPRWDTFSLVDPLNLRCFAAPLKLVQLGKPKDRMATG